MVSEIDKYVKSLKEKPLSREEFVGGFAYEIGHQTGKYQRLLGVAQKKLGEEYCRADAEDVLSDILARFLENLPNFTPGNRAWPYLITCIQNQCIDRKRRDTFKEGSRLRGLSLRVNNKETLITDPSTLPDEQIEEQEHKERVHEGISRLNENLRQVMILKYIEDLKYREIAKRLSIPFGTVKSRAWYGRKQLEKILRARGLGKKAA